MLITADFIAFVHDFCKILLRSQATERSGIASAANSFKENLCADEGAPYDEIIEIDLDALRPHVNGPFTPDLAHPVGTEFTAAVKVSLVFVAERRKRERA